MFNNPLVADCSYKPDIVGVHFMSMFAFDLIIVLYLPAFSTHSKTKAESEELLIFFHLLPYRYS